MKVWWPSEYKLNFSTFYNSLNHRRDPIKIITLLLSPLCGPDNRGPEEESNISSTECNTPPCLPPLPHFMPACPSLASPSSPDWSTSPSGHRGLALLRISEEQGPLLGDVAAGRTVSLFLLLLLPPLPLLFVLLQALSLPSQLPGNISWLGMSQGEPWPPLSSVCPSDEGGAGRL